MQEAEYETAELYDNFNHFFTRALTEGARPIDNQINSIVSPCDGIISQLGDIKHQKIIQAKNHDYTVSKLLAGQTTLANIFTDGHFINCYLSPKDYHRLHMPIDGTLKQTIYVPGSLFSVNPTTADNINDLFARNERLICEFDTAIGPMALVMVGATIVAGIETIWSGQVAPPPKGIKKENYTEARNITLKKGDEMGRFKLGSTVILLFPKDSIKFVNDLKSKAELQMGEAIGFTQ